MSKPELSDKSLIIVFAYAPAGLGHLRVTSALYHGLPREITPILLGSQDKSIGYIHRLISVHPFTRSVMEWTQRGFPEDIFTKSYRNFLRHKTKLLEQQVSTILDQRLEVPKTVLFIATHFALAHQLAAIKNKLASEKGIKIILAVQVTDDTPQHIWYIEGADMIFVPSEKTKNALEDYGLKNKLEKVRFEVLPYPVDPDLSKKLSELNFEDKKDQVNILRTNPINVSIPISGAAVGTDFFKILIESLHKKSERFNFFVVAKTAIYTQKFLKQMKNFGFVNLLTATHDRQVIEIYEKEYLDNTVSLEITKPSEQAFKALIDPDKVGGSILLFSQPVGKQENDNLDFLRRHNLLPSDTMQKILFEKARKDLTLEDQDGRIILEDALNWRCIKLPSSPKLSGEFIWWCLKNELFYTMMDYGKIENESFEVSSKGVKEFWKKIEDFIVKSKD